MSGEEKRVPSVKIKRKCWMCGDWFTADERDNGAHSSYCPGCRKYAEKFEREMRGEAKDGE